MALGEGGRRYLRQLDQLKQRDPRRFFWSRQMMVKRQELLAKAAGRPRLSENQALERELASEPRSYPGKHDQDDPRSMVMKSGSVVIKRGRSGGQTVPLRGTQSTTGPVQERNAGVRAGQAAHKVNSSYYAHLQSTRDQQNNQTRSTAQRPINRSDAGFEGIGRSPASGQVVNEADEGRHVGAALTDDQRARLQAELDAIRETSRKNPKKYRASEKLQARERALYDMGLMPSD